MDQLKADPIWGNLPPIRDDRVYLWTENPSWYRDPIAVERQISSLASWIAEVSGRQAQ